METEGCSCGKILLTHDGFMPEAELLHNRAHAESGLGAPEYLRQDSPDLAKAAGFAGPVLLLRDGQLVRQAS